MSRLVFVLALGGAVMAPLFAQNPAAQSSMLISTSELAAQLTSPSLVVLHVDARDASFAEGHLPGARFVRYGDFAVDGAGDVGSELPPADQLQRVFRAAGVSDDSRVVVYGTSTVVAARAFFTLDAAGHRHVALLDGGLKAWRTEGRPVETGPPRPVRAGTFSPALDAAKVVDAQFIQRHAPGSEFALVDVRPDPEFLGSDGGMGGMHSPGHIAGARQLTWDSLVGPDGRFLPRDELKAKLQTAGAAPGKPVVSYCMVGMRASVVYFVARYLGYDARLYDGSIVDWSARKLPTTTGRE